MPIQIVQVFVANGYHPSTIEAVAGMPLRLVFRRADPNECSDRVVFSEPRLVRYLAPDADTAVDLPAADEGEVRFTCGMGRYRGRIVRRAATRRQKARGRRVPWAALAFPWLLLLTTSIAADAPAFATWLVTTAASAGAALLILRPRLLPTAGGTAPEITLEATQ